MRKLHWHKRTCIKGKNKTHIKDLLRNRKKFTKQITVGSHYYYGNLNTTNTVILKLPYNNEHYLFLEDLVRNTLFQKKIKNKPV